MLYSGVNPVPRVKAPALQPSLPTLEQVRPVLVAFGHAHPEIVRVEVFGSVARGDATAESDVDVLATFRPGSLPFGPFGADYFGRLAVLESELAAVLGRGVHLLDGAVVDRSPAGAGQAFNRAVTRDAKRVYEPEPAAA